VAGTAVTTGSTATALLTNSPLAYGLAAAALAVVTLTAFVVLPAVWSRRTERRDSAFSVLRLLLGRDKS
jgi:O-antigen/teichoic acid export membrane protein